MVKSKLVQFPSGLHTVNLGDVLHFFVAKDDDYETNYSFTRLIVGIKKEGLLTSSNLLGGKGTVEKLIKYEEIINSWSRYLDVQDCSVILPNRKHFYALRARKNSMYKLKEDIELAISQMGYNHEMYAKAMVIAKMLKIETPKRHKYDKLLTCHEPKNSKE